MITLKGKKGIEAINMIVLIVIALVVLFVVLYIFKDQIGRALKGYTGVSTEAGETLEGVKCETILHDKNCQAGPTCAEGTKKINPPTGKEWKDCTPASGKPICCEEPI
jgi:hypothetical protein